MNTLQDLRATLDQHAGDVHADPSRARVAAVEGRARVVRRRRAAGVVVAAVLAVAGAVVVPSLDGSPQRGERWLAGHRAPLHLDALDYGYRFARGVEARSIRLAPSDQPRLLTWATDTGSAKLRDPNGETRPVTLTDFDDYAYVAPGTSGRWTLRTGDADAAFAVYDYDGELGSGVVAADLWFRTPVGDQVLVDAAGAPVGADELTMSIPAPAHALRLADFCTGVPRGHWINVSINGDGAVASSGCSGSRFDPGAGGTSYDAATLGVEPGGRVDVRMWVSRTAEGPVVDLPDVRLALGAYAVPEPADEVAGWDAPVEYEHDGHTWRYVDSAELTPGEGVLAPQGGVAGPTLALVSYRVSDSATVRVRVGDQVSIGQASGQEALVLDPADDLRVRVTRGLTPRTWLGAAYYERAD